jgi:O-antigen/teichoic acid export membrane protein
VAENYTRKAIASTLTVFLLGAGASLVGYLLRLLIARRLGPQEYGLVYAVMALFGLFSLFQHLGLGEALVRAIAEYRIKGKPASIKGAILTTLGIQFVTAALLAGAGVLLADWLAASYFHAPAAAELVRLYAIAILLSPLDIVFLAIFQGWQRTDLFSLVNFLRMAFILLATLALFALGLGAKAPILAYSIVYVLSLAIYYPLFATQVFPQFAHIRAALSRDEFRALVRYGLAVMMTSAAGLIIAYTDTTLLTALRPLEEVGQYNAALPTARVLWLIAQSLAIVLFPLATELWLKKPHYLRQGIELLYRYVALIIVPAALVILAFPELALRLLFGPAFEPAAPALRILAAAAILFTFSSVNSSVLSGIGKPQANSAITWVAAAANAIGNLLLIPRLGVAGSAIATLISFAFMLVLSTAVLRRHIAFSVPWAGWLKALLAGAAFIGIVTLVKRGLGLPVWPEVMLSLGLGTLAYVGLIFALRAVRIGELCSLLARVMQR